MTAPVRTIVQMQYQNPHASAPLILPVLVVCNTPDEQLHANIRMNAARDLDWIAMRPAHDGTAIIVGGGPSLADSLPQIRWLAEQGHTIFATNGASRYLSGRGVRVDHQVIADAKPETASLIDIDARSHLFASQVDASCFGAYGVRATLWHLGIADMEALFPAERVKRGGYALVGGGAAVGNSALCLAYVMGFRRLEVFGLDSSNRGDATHAFDQPMNRFIPCVDVEWAGRTYRASVAMKAQAEKFQITAQLLQKEGCTVNVHGDGLLPAMWNTPPEKLGERDKYRLMWGTEGYRDYSPAEAAVPAMLEHLRPYGLVLDLGCGTGRASIALAKAGCNVLLIDFADNCRDEEALDLPFLEWDLTRPLPPRANFGICCDVMEHIPPQDVETVVRNIMEAARKVFFQISTVPDRFGAVIHQSLHLSVHPAEWWAGLFDRLGFTVEWSEAGASDARFIVNA